MVASIMSKKLAAGSTHLLIDLPVGPTAKLANANEAMRLRKLFEFVGDHFGIAVEVITTDGRQPIGNGIGPVLEAQDVMAVLANDAGGAAPICAKSRCGSPRICWNTIRSCAAEAAMRGPANCSRAARRSSRCRRSSMRRVLRPAAPIWARLTFDVTAAADGVVAGIDCLRLNRLARTAGAPIDKGAGIRLFKKIGDQRRTGRAALSRLRLRPAGIRSRGGCGQSRCRLHHRWRRSAIGEMTP